MVNNCAMNIVGFFLISAVLVGNAQHVENYGYCTSPDGLSGTCVELKNCQKIFTLLRKHPMTEDERTFVSGSQCGYRNRTILVCCSDSIPTTQPSFAAIKPILRVSEHVENYGYCTSPDGLSGTCVELKNCQKIFRLLRKHPMTEDERAFVSGSQCGNRNGTILVCCSDSIPTTQPSFAVINTKLSENDSSPLNADLKPVSVRDCLTPSGESAACILFNRCTLLYKMLQKPMSNENVTLLRQSRCRTGYPVFVCCPERYIGAELPKPGVCGRTYSDRINGGNMTNLDEHPWMALIEYESHGQSIGHKCAGSVINDRYILTAAHCVQNIPSSFSPVRVRLGEWDTSVNPDCKYDAQGYQDCADPHVDIAIEKLIIFDEFSTQTYFDDIALIRLSQRIHYTYFIQPICLPVNEDLKRANFDGTKMEVVGWGLTELGTSSNQKLKAELPIISLSECQQIYNRINRTLRNSQICAGGVAGIDSCRGDSGGPLVRIDTSTSNEKRPYKFIAGIVSYGGIKCGLAGWPAIYTRVDKYIDWILRNVEA